MMKETTSKKKKRKKKKPMDQDGNNDQKQNIARFRSSVIALCLAAMAVVLMASNVVVVDSFVLLSNVHRLNGVSIIMEQNVIAANGSDVCNYVNCNDVMEVVDVASTMSTIQQLIVW